MRHFECSAGRFALVRNPPTAIEQTSDDAGTPVPEVMQAKEKFGRLNFYLLSACERVSTLID